MKSQIVVALAGNPNSGKSTIFNNLTGTRQHVGNYPGVTVERKEGYCSYNNIEMKIVDLPGTYSLTAYSAEEVVARDFLVEEQPDVVVDIIDASNLERNLYLTVQLKELGVPLVLVFNMIDTARSRGYEFDIEKLSQFLGAPVVKTVGHKAVGMEELLEAIISTASVGRGNSQKKIIDYGEEIEAEIAAFESLLGEEEPILAEKYGTRWLAVKILENDKDLRARISSPQINKLIEKRVPRIETILGESLETAIASRRYGFISGVCQEAVRSTIEVRHTISDKIDTVVTNRVLGIPIFLALMYLVFHLTFTLGEPAMGWIEEFFSWLGGVVSGWWPEGSESPLRSLLLDGVIGGVGGVIVFLPNILLLFMAISILEDSGYMARVAFIMDRMMQKIGLHGKSFIPMLIGFGCSVPAIMATRTLENRQDRLVTMLVTPLMSCGARLPIYALIIPAFFPQAWHAPMLWTIYMIGIILAILSAKLLKRALLKGESVPFVMELPPYRMPTVKGVLIHMWERGQLYLKKAGTIILAISIILWAMTSYPKKDTYDRDYDAERIQAQETFLAQVKQLNTLVGLDEESKVLVDFARSDLGMTSGETSSHAEGAELLATFTGIVNEIKKIRSEFEKVVEESGVEEGTPDYVLLKQKYDSALTRLQEKDPEVYAAAVKYLEEMKSSLEERLAKIDQEQQAEELAYSVAGRIGHGLEPFLRPMGFDWRIGTALIGAFAAKEVFVAQMGIVYSVGEADEESDALREQLRSNYSPLAAFCIMLFCLISAPCMATIAVTKRESNSWKWALFQLGGLTALAYVVTTLVFQAGSIMGIGTG